MKRRAFVLAVVVALAGAVSCSVFNREGPHETCETLDGGAANACHDGIIAFCLGGQMVYEICDNASVCEESWQKAGAFLCTQASTLPQSRSSDGSTPPPTGCDAGCDTVSVAAVTGIPSSLAVNGDDLFYCVDAGVWRVKKTGGTAQRLGDVIGGCGAGMFVDERDVWVVSAQAPSTIVRVAKTPGLASLSFEDTRNVGIFGIDVEYMYWIDVSGSVRKRPKADFVAAATTMNEGASFRLASLQVEADRVYWLTNTGLASLPTSAKIGSPISFVNLTDVPTSFRIADGAVYWTAATQGVRRTDLGSGSSATLASALGAPAAIALGSDAVYWAESARIARVSKAGGAAETLASEGTALLAADGDGVYWYANGQLRSVSR